MLISLSFYLAMVLVLTRLRASQQGLEKLVHERTAALREEIMERVRLETALLGVSEREQRRIGHELHDSLCQHLTGTALAAQVLSGELASRGIKEAKNADNLVTMIEEGIDLSRSLARGLAPLDLDAEGLAEALRALASVTSVAGQVKCQLLVQSSLAVSHSELATQLFRIAQEAVRNAQKHADATLIIIRLEQDEKGVSLVVEDDGKGLPHTWRNGDGMGMHIMRYRATMVGAQFSVRMLERGTQVSVRSSSFEQA
jgi:signal transduction histidine kinase